MSSHLQELLSINHVLTDLKQARYCSEFKSSVPLVEGLAGEYQAKT